jgi:hypothetical protein
MCTAAADESNCSEKRISGELNLSDRIRSLSKSTIQVYYPSLLC